ncbi:hypothetical protein BKA80DRAFT_64723 [Phyllosticta citrichinensis]
MRRRWMRRQCGSFYSSCTKFRDGDGRLGSVAFAQDLDASRCSFARDLIETLLLDGLGCQFVGRYRSLPKAGACTSTIAVSSLTIFERSLASILSSDLQQSNAPYARPEDVRTDTPKLTHRIRVCLQRQASDDWRVTLQPSCILCAHAFRTKFTHWAGWTDRLGGWDKRTRATPRTLNHTKPYLSDRRSEQNKPADR